jgi:YVTN family beta-propeller protein
MKRLGAVWAAATMVAVALVGVSPASVGAAGGAGGSGTGCPTQAYVINQGGNSVSVIEVASGTVVGAPIAVGASPFGVAFTPCVVVGARVGVDGRSVTVTGSQFAPGSVLTVSIASTPTTLGTVTVAADGTFTATYTVPCSIPGGAHTISATAVSGQSASFPVTLTDCGPEPEPEPTFTG